VVCRERQIMEISDFRILSRHDADRNEKCPHCSMIFQNFLIIDDLKLGCLRCGTVFVKKEARDFVRDPENCKKIMAQKTEEELAQDIKDELDRRFPGNFICQCGFVAKNKVGLSAHQRHCEELKAEANA
jgi:uncharacterized C2H2 Zn-finger protein